MKKSKYRLSIIALVMLMLMSALIYQLGTLTLAEGAYLSKEASGRSLRKIALKGVRGRILDKNGIVLAYSETCYNVEFFRDPEQRTSYDNAMYTEALIKAIRIIEAGGCKTINTSYIQKNEAGEIVYDWGVKDEAAIKKRFENFRKAMGFSNENITAEEAYKKLREYWYIPEEMSFEDALKVISIRQEVLLNNYQAYQPVTIAYDVSLEVVAEIDMRKDELMGIQTTQSTTRVYPYGKTAAHIVGYLSSNATEEMVKEKGYSYSDYVGVTGIEKSMEEYLTGSTKEKQGSKTIEVNKNGSLIRTISSTPPTDGDDVVLTIDFPLQQKTEEALEKLIQTISENEKKLIQADEDGKYSKKTNNNLDSIDTAKTGAIVVMDVNSGQVLSMTSYPSFDPNWFIDGLSEEQRIMLFEDEETTVMRNKAISARMAPGSIFKMVTGLGGLMEGVIGVNDTIDDKSPYILYTEDGTPITQNAPSCWTSHPENHAGQNITKALTNSCNYYFCEVANRLGINKLNDWAGYLGLTSSTGIELPGEAVGIVGGQKVLYDNTLPLEKQQTSMPLLVYNQLCELLEGYLTIRNMEIDEEAVKRCASRLMALQDGSLDNKGNDIRLIMREELGLPEGVTRLYNWVNQIVSSLTQLQWKATITIRSGFGQGVSLVTPIAVARYVSAIANKGTVYDAHIVSRIQNSEGKLVKEITPTVYNQIDAPEEFWTSIHEGLKGVVSPEDQGTAANKFSQAFKDGGYQDMLSGKTGTAQTGTSSIDIENTSWFVCFAPRESPEIAIVVCIPNGYSGSSSVLAIEEIIRFYIDRKAAAAPENLVDINAITP